MKNVLVCQMENGREPFNEWFHALDTEAQIKVDDFIFRMASGGSRKNIRSLGGGISELKIDLWPGLPGLFRGCGQRNHRAALGR